MVNSIEAIEACHDKFRTSIMLDEAGIPTPKTSIITELDLALAAHEEVGGKFPVVLKTVSGAGGKGVFIIDSDISLKQPYQYSLRVTLMRNCSFNNSRSMETSEFLF